MMKKNVGTVDKIIRIVLALVIGALYALNVISGTLGLVLLVASGVFLVTGLINFCGLYALLGINTCPAKKA